MGRGVEIYGQAGNLQASTDRYCWALSGHGSLLMNDTGQTHPQPRVRGYIDVAGVNPEIFIYPPEGKAVFLEQFQPISGGFRYTFGAVSSSPVAFQYWVFDVPSQGIKDPALASMGIQVFDQSLTVTYDAATDTLDTKALVTVTTPPSQAATTNGDVSYDRYSIGDQQSFAIPQGRKYAVSIAGLANIQGMQDTGQYATGSTYPNNVPIRVDDPDNQPGGNYTWRRMRLDTLWSGVKIQNGTLTVGNSFVEQFEGWYAMGTNEVLSCYGVGRFMIADVTDLSSTGLPSNPNAPVVNVSATERRIEINGPAQNTITPAVTLTISGGTAPYTIQWERIGGGSETVQPYGSTTSTSFQTQVTSQQPDTTHTATFRARVVSATGVVSYSPDVRFVHVAQAYSVDVTPEPFSITNFAPNSAAEVAYGTPRVFQITGINQAISLRLARSASSSSSNITLNQLKLRTGPSSSGPWSDVGILYGNGQIDFTASNGAWFELTIEIRTQAGRGTAQYNAEITNQSAGGTSLAAFNFNGVVDNDNNYNVVDTTPDLITNWPSINGVVNDNDYSWSTSWYGEHYITGINVPITLRVEVYDYNSPNNLDALFVDVFTWPPGASDWTHHGYFSAHVAGADGLRKMDIPNVKNGTRVSVNAHAITNSGRKSATCRLVLWSITGVGGQFASANQSFVVDDDNNYNVPRYNLDPIDWDNANFSTNDNTGAAATGWRAISGINRDIKLRAEISNITGQGYNLADGGNLIPVSNKRGDLYYKPWRDGGSFTFTVQNGEEIRFYCDAYTTQGRKQYGYDVHVYNDTTGAFVDHHYQSGILDADNNWNPNLSVTLDTNYLSPGHEYFPSGRNVTLEAGSATGTVVGGRAPYTFQWEKLDGTAAWTIVNPTTSRATFRCQGRTNFMSEANFRLKVTDADNRVAYSEGVYAQVSAGNAEI